MAPTLIYQQQQNAAIPWEIGGQTGDETTCMLTITADMPILYPDGSSDTIPALTAAVAPGAVITFDRTAWNWLGYTVPGSNVLSLIPEYQLSSLSDDVAVLCRITRHRILDWAPTQVLAPAPTPPELVVWVCNAGADHDPSISRFNTDGSPDGATLTPYTQYPARLGTVGDEIWMTVNTGSSMWLYYFDRTGASVRSPLDIGGGGSIGCAAIVDVPALSQAWIVYVQSDGSPSVITYDYGGTDHLSYFPGSPSDNCSGAAVVGDQLWVVNTGPDSITRINLSDGSSAGADLTGNGLSTPEGIGVFGAEVQVVNAGDNSISRFDFSGGVAGTAFAAAVGGSGNYCMGVVGSNGWVAQANTNTIYVYSSADGSVVTTITGNDLDFPVSVVCFAL